MHSAPNSEVSQKLRCFFLFDELRYFVSHRSNMIGECHDYFDLACIGALVAADNKHSIKINDITYPRFNFIGFKFLPFAYIVNMLRTIIYCKKNSINVFYIVSVRCILYSLPLLVFFQKSTFVLSFTGLGSILSNGHTGAFRAFQKNIVEIFFRLAGVLYRRKIVLLSQNASAVDYLSRLFLIDPKDIWNTGGVGVDLDSYPAACRTSSLPVKVMFVGRLVFDKGILEFLNAASHFSNSCEKIQFTVVGDIDSRSPSRIPYNQLDVYRDLPNIDFKGALSNNEVIRLMYACDVICLPSYHEGFPKVLVEAAAAGMAMIATEVDGCRECVFHDYNGILVPSRSVSKLIDAFNVFIHSPDLIVKFGVNSRKIAEDRFSKDLFIDVNKGVFSVISSRIVH